jgi:hypothetical protein
MNIFGANISFQAFTYFSDTLKGCSIVEDANEGIYIMCGIVDFFGDQREFDTFKEVLSISENMLNEPDRTEYGDFQTNAGLASETVLFLKSRGVSPEIVIEPTCGKGSFIIASLRYFNRLQAIVGVEIYRPYVWECKFSIIDFFLANPSLSRPDIHIYHFNVFDFDFNSVENNYRNKNCLIIGNPPWVTNSQLGCLNSNNLPKKLNFKKHSGMDAITGKGNFDIAEYITEMLLRAFQETTGHIALLVKNSVINPAKVFGWVGDRFVSDIERYVNSKEFDGESPFIWRQGIKHDCTKIMELDKQDGHFLNKLDEKVALESDLVYGFLKSSDLKNTVAQQTRKFTIVTQTKIGQETTYIKHDYPQTYAYLLAHKSFFDARKSSIYNNKPLFSIFGVGDYSFMPYKIAISGLYKTFHFTFVLPQENKPVMLDDTCYFIGFEKIEFAAYTLSLLNAPQTIKLLESITFPDAKRTFTKDTLMRVDLFKLSRNVDFEEIKASIDKLNSEYNLNISLNAWDHYLKTIKPEEQLQLLFP